MRTPFLFALPVIALSTAVFAQDAPKEKSPAVLETDSAKMSYVIGLQFGGSLKQAGMELDMAAFAAAVEDAVKDREPALSREQMAEVQNALREQMNAKRAEMMKKQEEENKAASAKNKTAADEFLKTNGARPEVKTTASGLQYEVLTEGTGPSPKATDTVSVNYKGTLIDGTTFDSSYDRGEPATFQINNLIPGWVEALPMMKVGAKWKLYIPAELGYGDRGMGVITPGSLLIFEMELLEIKAAEKPAGGENAGGGDSQTITIQ